MGGSGRIGGAGGDGGDGGNPYFSNSDGTDWYIRIRYSIQPHTSQCCIRWCHHSRISEEVAVAVVHTTPIKKQQELPLVEGGGGGAGIPAGEGGAAGTGASENANGGEGNDGSVSEGGAGGSNANNDGEAVSAGGGAGGEASQSAQEGVQELVEKDQLMVEEIRVHRCSDKKKSQDSL